MEQRVPQDTRSHSIRFATFEEYEAGLIVVPIEGVKELYARIDWEHDGPCETTGLLSTILDSIMETEDHPLTPPKGTLLSTDVDPNQAIEWATQLYKTVNEQLGLPEDYRGSIDEDYARNAAKNFQAITAKHLQRDKNLILWGLTALHGLYQAGVTDTDTQVNYLRALFFATGMIAKVYFKGVNTWDHTAKLLGYAISKYEAHGKAPRTPWECLDRPGWAETIRLLPTGIPARGESPRSGLFGENTGPPGDLRVSGVIAYYLLIIEAIARCRFGVAERLLLQLFWSITAIPTEGHRSDGSTYDLIGIEDYDNESFPESIRHEAAALYRQGKIAEADLDWFHNTKESYHFIRNWISSGSKVISISAKAGRTLKQVGVKREGRGASPIRWHDLPAPEDPLHKETIMLKWELEFRPPPSSGRRAWTGPVYSCIVSTGLHFAEEISHCLWLSSAAPYEKGDIRTMITKKMNAVIRAVSLGITKEAERHILEVRKDPNNGGLVEMILAGANCLAALNSEIHVTKRVIPKKRGKKGSRGSRGRRSKQPTIRLDEGGLGVWITRHEYLDKKHAKEKRRIERAKRPTPYAEIKPGRANKWVLEPRPGENILGMRERSGKKEGVLYLVNRPRKEYSRGELVVIKESRLKCGVDDLLITKIGRDDDDSVE